MCVASFFEASSVTAVYICKGLASLCTLSHVLATSTSLHLLICCVSYVAQVVHVALIGSGQIGSQTIGPRGSTVRNPTVHFFRADCWRDRQLAPVPTVPVPVQLSMAKFALSLFLSCIFVFFVFFLHLLRFSFHSKVGVW